MDVYFQKKGINLSKKQPFQHPQNQQPLPTNKQAFCFTIPSQLNSYHQPNTDRPLMEVPQPRNNQPIHHHSHNKSFDPYSLKLQEVNIGLMNKNNVQFRRESALPSLKFIPIMEQSQEKKFNCAKTVISTQDSFMISKDFEDLKSVDKNHDHLNSSNIFNEQNRLSIQTIMSQFSEEKAKLANHLAEEKNRNGELMKEMNTLRSINNENLGKLQELQGQNALLKRKIVEINFSQQKALQKIRQTLEKQFNSKLLLLQQAKANFNGAQQEKRVFIEAERAMLEQIKQKSEIICTLENALAQRQRQFKEKIIGYELEMRKFQGNKNRLEMEAQNSKKLLKMEREKTDRQKGQMTKMIFFEQDLLRAKDYEKVKEDNALLLVENEQLYEDHKSFMAQVAQHRQHLELQIFKMAVQIKNLQKQMANDRQKFNRYLQNNDKLALIKLQNDYNFMKKQIEETRLRNEQLQVLTESKSQEIADLRLRIAENKKRSDQKNLNLVDQHNIKNIQNTISIYETRLQDISNLLKIKEAQNEKNKRTMDCLTSQLRKTREEKNINQLKDKNLQNNLKNDIQNLRRIHQVELNLIHKKLVNLQDSLKRKSKEVVQKEAFINRIMRQRVKQVITQVVNQVIPQVVPQVIPSVVCQVMPQIVPQVTPQLVPEVVVQMITQVEPQMMPLLASQMPMQVIPQVISQVIPYITPQMVSQKILQLVLEREQQQVIFESGQQFFLQMNPIDII